MFEEIEAAARWWAQCLARADVQPQQVNAFKKHLQIAMLKSFKNHWYQDKPLKGQALRAIEFDAEYKQVDAILLQSATEAGISDIGSKFSKTLGDGARMWVDPGEVSAMNLSIRSQSIIYKAPKRNKIKEFIPSFVPNYRQSNLPINTQQFVVCKPQPFNGTTFYSALPTQEA